MKGELEELGEESEGVENISKMQGQILNMTKGKVNIFGDNGEFRSTYDIMKDIASIYDELTSTDRAKLLETLAGKNRANDVAALIENFDTAIKMAETAENSTGSAARENAKYVDSLQGRIDIMTASLQAFSNTAMNSDFLKGGVSAITGIIDAFTKLVNVVGGLPTLLGAGAAAFSLFNKGIVTVDKTATGAMNKFKLFGSSISDIKGMIGELLSGGGLAGALSFGREDIFSGFKDRLSKDKQDLADYIDKLSIGDKAGAADVYNQSGGFVKEYIDNTDEATRSVAAFEEAQKQSFVQLQASNKSLKLSSGVINEYNAGCKNVGMSQKDFADSVGQVNPVMGNYLSGLNGAKASMGGYIKSLVKSKLATIGLTVASTALNAVITVGIGAAIGFVVNKIGEWIHAEENLAESVDDATSSYKQQHEELSKGKSKFDKAAESYEKLHKGVDKLNGKNISLTPDEYDEYINAANTIADMVPSLVSGYDAQGNAILDCAGDVDTLTDAYNKLIVAENNKLLNGDGEDYKGIKDISKDLKNDFDNAHLKQKNTAEHLDSVFKSGSISKESILKNIGINAYSVARSVAEELEAANKTIEGVELPDSNATKEEAAEYLSAVYGQYPDILRGIINNANSEMDAITQEMRTAMNAHMENAFLSGSYENIDEEMQDIVSDIVSGIDSGLIIDKNASGGSDAILEYIDGIMGAINNMAPEAQKKLKSAFDIQDAFSSADINFGEYKKQIEDVSKTIDSLNVAQDVKQALKDSLNADGVIEQYDGIVKSLGELGVEGAEEFANGLNSSELKVYYDVVAEIGDDSVTADELKKKLEFQASIADALEFEIDIEDEAKGIEAINTAMKESVSATGMATSSINALKSRYAELDSYDPTKVFVKTSQGIRVNRDEINKLEQDLARTKLDGAEQSINDLKSAYEDVTKRIRTCNDAAERQTLLTKQSLYADKISELEEMQSQYEGLTSAYNNWINAQAGGEEGDIYDDVKSKLESAAELRKKGLVGTNEFAAATEFMSGKDTSNMSTSDIVAAYDNALPKMKRYFTESADGTQNLLYDLQGLNEEWVSLGENGWDINMSADDIAKAAEQLGVSSEAIEAIFGKGKDYGLEINYDSVYDATKSLEQMRTEAESANNKLIEMGEETVTFSFESTDIEYLDSSIAQAQETLDKFKNTDGTVNIDTPGAKEAQAQLAALISQKQKVSQPAFMDVSLSTIGDDKLSSVISMLQQFQTYKNISDINVAIGADNSEAQAKIGETITQLNNLKKENPQVFADLGLNEDSFNNALATLTGNVTAGVELDANAQSTITTALSGITPQVLANVGIGDTTEVDTYASTKQTASGTVNWDNDTTLVDAYQAAAKTAPGSVIWDDDTTRVKTSFTATGTINWGNTTPPSSGVSPVNGTAHSNGTAFVEGSKKFRRGDWGTKDSGTALMGELGQETIVRDGRFFTVGDNGAEFVKYKRGDVIFNHKILFCGVA